MQTAPNHGVGTWQHCHPPASPVGSEHTCSAHCGHHEPLTGDMAERPWSHPGCVQAGGDTEGSGGRTRRGLRWFLSWGKHKPAIPAPTPWLWQLGLFLWFWGNLGQILGPRGDVARPWVGGESPSGVGKGRMSPGRVGIVPRG